MLQLVGSVGLNAMASNLLAMASHLMSMASDLVAGHTWPYNAIQNHLGPRDGHAVPKTMPQEACHWSHPPFCEPQRIRHVAPQWLWAAAMDDAKRRMKEMQ